MDGIGAVGCAVEECLQMTGAAGYHWNAPPLL
jgi:hypothetical protein